MTNHQVGHDAEKQASEYLSTQGFATRELNWKNRFCEIDIVAERDGCIYFVEVKYRRSNAWGSGLEYITPKKLKQMKFAAEMWVSNENWRGDYQLAAISMSPGQVEFIDSF